MEQLLEGCFRKEARAGAVKSCEKHTQVLMRNLPLGRLKPQSCRDCLTNRYVLHFYCSAVRSFEIVLAGELFNRLYKRPSLYWLKPLRRALAGAVCLSDVQMMTV